MAVETRLFPVDVLRAREEIRQHVGTVTVEADEREIRLYSEQGSRPRCCEPQGAARSMQVSLVAGAGFEPATFGL